MNQPANNNEEVIEVTEQQIKEYQDIQKLRDSLVRLQKNKDFKKFMKSYMEESVVQLAHNLGVQPQMKDELIMQLEARRVLKSFMNVVMIQGQTADDVLGGLDE